MLVPYAPRSPISIDKAFEKQFFFFFPLEKHDLSSIVKKRTIFQFFLLLPLESEILPDLSIRFDAAKFSAEPSIHRSSSYRKGKKKPYCLSRERRKYRLLRGYIVDNER